MRKVLDYVKHNPGCNKLAPALIVCPYGKRVTAHFGYRVVNRCIFAGLISANRLKSGSYELTYVRDTLSDSN
jgi:hypothetical protein